MSLTSQPTKSTAAHFHAAPPSDRISDSSVRSSGMYSNIQFTRASHHPAAFCALPYGSLLVPFIAFIRLLSIFCIISEFYYLSRDLLFLRQRRQPGMNLPRLHKHRLAVRMFLPHIAVIERRHITRPEGQRALIFLHQRRNAGNVQIGFLVHLNRDILLLYIDLHDTRLMSKRF